MQKSILTIIVSWLLLFCSAEIKAASPADAGTDTVPTKITELQEVVAVRKEKYRKKGNPAVALIEKIRKASQGSDPRNGERYPTRQCSASTTTRSLPAKGIRFPILSILPPSPASPC